MADNRSRVMAASARFKGGRNDFHSGYGDARDMFANRAGSPWQPYVSGHAQDEFSEGELTKPRSRKAWRLG